MKNKICGGLSETEMTPFQGDHQGVPARAKEKGNFCLDGPWIWLLSWSTMLPMR